METDLWLPLMISIMMSLAILQSSWIFYKIYHRRSQTKLAEEGHSIWSSSPSSDILETRRDLVLDTLCLDERRYDKRILYGVT